MICLCASILTVSGDTQTNNAASGVWWSLKPVVRPALPEGPESNPIDRFIDSELRAQGLTAVGPADKLSRTTHGLEFYGSRVILTFDDAIGPRRSFD